MGGKRKTKLALVCVLCLTVLIITAGCTGLAETRTSPVRALAYDDQNDILYIGTTPAHQQIDGGGGLGIYNLSSKKITVKNTFNGFPFSTVNKLTYDQTSGLLYCGDTQQATMYCIYNPSSTEIIRIMANSKSGVAPAGDKYFKIDSSYVIKHNFTDGAETVVYNCTTPTGPVYVVAMAYLEGSLYISMTGQKFVIINGSRITEVPFNITVYGFAKTPTSNTVFLQTHEGLFTYDIDRGTVASAGYSGGIVQMTMDPVNKMIYATCDEGYEVVVKAIDMITLKSKTLFDDNRSSKLKETGLSIAFSRSRNSVFIGVESGLIIYNISTKTIHTKDYKDGMPADRGSHYKVPGFDAISATVAITTLLAVQSALRRRKEKRI